MYLGQWRISHSHLCMGNMAKSPGKAKKWLLKSANSSQSQYHLGECYFVGGPSPFGTFEKSLEDALKWYLAAADRGFAGAYTRLAQMHRKGLFFAAEVHKKHWSMPLLRSANDPH
mmetsp:Transcript_30400/g.64349  ORF Transcript_30400/g.64349 Transcript_30400/m.64349 type:complete len:115 (+) Transcript_30400:949-1293(+)